MSISSLTISAIGVLVAVVFVETPIFNRRVQRHMADDEYAEMQAFLVERPGAGSIIRGSGGIRKLRWAGSGRGKRGGMRVGYYWWVAGERITLLMVYPKSERDDLTASQLRELRSQLAP
jgi:mRNA-degrading endonuclease RelE of RelBE toxin-antitoxin system